MVDNLARKLDVSPEVEIEVSETPVKWCAVSLSEVVDRGKRLEASVFDVEAKQAYDIVSRCIYKSKKLIGDSGFVKKAHYGNRLKRNYVAKTHELAIGFIGSSEMLDIYPQPIKFMADSDMISNLRVTKNTVLISRSGTIGNVAFVNKTLEKLLVSEHAIRLECRDVPGYIYCFLMSKTGQKLIKSKTYGAVVSQIEPEHIADIPVPDAPYEIQSKINDLILRSYKLRDQSNEMIDQAQDLLIHELKLPPINDIQADTLDKKSTVQTFNVKLSEISGRVDASYHVPIVDAILDILKENAAEVTTIGDERISADVILPGRFKRVYVEEGHGKAFIGGKQISELDPTSKKYLSVTKHNKRIAEELEIKENATLITRSGTIGKVCLVPKHWQSWVASEHIIRVIPANNEVAGYISIFLSSDYGYELIKHFTYGSVVDEIDDNHVRQVQIPILRDQGVQKQINELALEANKKRYEAYLLEQEALKILDNEVIYAR